MKRITKDFETRSMCDLKKEGAYKYSLHPTTQPTCLAFKIWGDPKIYFLDFELVNTHWRDLPDKFKDLWTRLILNGFEMSAHNSFFERCIYDNIMVKRLGWPFIHPRKRRCTAAKAAACALPRNLEGAGEALKLRIQKDRRGYVAMMLTCKPTKKWKAWKTLQDKVAAGARITEKSRVKAREPEPPIFLEPDVAPEVFQTLYTYCKIDVRTEELLDETLPDLIPAEQEMWFLNQEINWRGLRIDIPTVTKIVDIMAEESKKKLKELDKVTMGLVTKPGARKSIFEFLALEGIVLPDLRSKTVDDKLKDFDISEDMHRLLEIRKALSLTSTKKYQSFINRAASDGRVRDILMYHGASTGRDTGVGIQPHNFPRGLVKMSKDRPYAHVMNVAECHPEMLRILYGDTLPMLFSALLRNMILPSPGCELFVADFSKIEVAVLWWLADNHEGLAILKAGKDPYIYQAAINTGKTYEEIERAVDAEEKWAVDARQLGKAQILGCGFGMGSDKFQSSAWDMYRLKLSLEDSKIAVHNYRKANAVVPKLWKAYENAAIDAVETGKAQRAGKCKFFVKDKFLWIELPSGRRLAYYEPQIAWRESDYGPRKTLEFWAVNSKTKKWSLERSWGGTICENCVQAVARDLKAEAMKRLEKDKYPILLEVHDEIIADRKTATGSLDGFIKLMCQTPLWADENLPIEAKGWIGPRYRK